MGLEKIAFEPIHHVRRTSLLGNLAIWGGLMLSLPMFLQGATKLSRMPIGSVFWATLVGFFILFLIMYLQAAPSCDLGLPTVILSEGAFGKYGSAVIVCSILTLSLMGWYGMQTALAGDAVTTILEMRRIKAPENIGPIVLGTLMTLTAIMGYKGLESLIKIAMLALLILCGYTLFSLNDSINLLAKIPFKDLFKLKTTLKDFLWAIDLSISAWILQICIAADYFRYAKKREDVLVTGWVAVVFWPLLLTMTGVILGMFTRSADPSIAMNNLRHPIMAASTVILTSWITHAISLYSGGLAVTRMLGLPSQARHVATAILGAGGLTLAMMGILEKHMQYLSLIGKGIAPIIGVMIANYWLIGKGRYEKWRIRKGWHFPGIIAWAAGVFSTYKISWGIANINAIIIAALSYYLLIKIMPLPKKG